MDHFQNCHTTSFFCLCPTFCIYSSHSANSFVCEQFTSLILPFLLHGTQYDHSCVLFPYGKELGKRQGRQRGQVSFFCLLKILHPVSSLLSLGKLLSSQNTLVFVSVFMSWVPPGTLTIGS